uniref:Uncharacterized protein n=1 Tax=Leersia perrieri TaxID=77586 RepID=A0A0D9VU38_9ORYZ
MAWAWASPACSASVILWLTLIYPSRSRPLSRWPWIYAYSGAAGFAVSDCVPSRKNSGGLPAWGQFRGGRSDGTEPEVLQGDGAEYNEHTAILAGRADAVVPWHAALTRLYGQSFFNRKEIQIKDSKLCFREIKDRNKGLSSSVNA